MDRDLDVKVLHVFCRDSVAAGDFHGPELPFLKSCIRGGAKLFMVIVEGCFELVI